jgi:hypothetical protein
MIDLNDDSDGEARGKSSAGVADLPPISLSERLRLEDLVADRLAGSHGEPQARNMARAVIDALTDAG